jgi:hypothetical protein
MKSFKERLAGLRDFARQGGKSREKQQASDGNSSSSSYQAGGHEGGYLEPTVNPCTLLLPLMLTSPVPCAKERVSGIC